MAKIQGRLTPTEQLKTLSRIWGNDRRGYVFLPWIDGSCETKDERRKSFHEGRAYKWPRERDAILQHIADRANDDLYFSVNLFDKKRRIEQNVAAERVLFADLDPVNPGKLEARPTVAWESSPNHFQGVWLLDEPKQGATRGGQENHRLTAAIGADPSGWDSTQLLRVPGRPNYKPKYKDENNGKPVMGKGLLWMDGPRYVWDDFADLPAVGAVTKDDAELDAADEASIDAVNRREVWNRVRLKCSSLVREYMALKTPPDGSADRDQVLWQIERDLADAGCTLVEIVALVRDSVWNKYRGRNDEMKRLKIEAAKAIAQVEDKPLEASADDEPKPTIQWLSEVVQQHIPRPRWLVKDIWTKGGLGFISGAPKSYKSWMAIDMAVTIATGGYWMNQPGYKCDRPQPVLYLQEEDDIRLVMDRLAKITEAKAPDQFWHGQMYTTGEYTGEAGSPSVDVYWAAPTRDIPIALHVQTGFIASDPEWQAWLDSIVEEGKFAMVIIDTLGTTAGDIDTDKSGELMTKMLKPLRTVARKHDCAIMMVHHNKKAANQGGRAGQDMLGSTALHAWVECAIYARSKDAKGEIQIEREAKLAMDLQMKVKIPMMFENIHTGERQLWDPEVITEGLETMHEPQPDRHTSGGGGGRGSAGKQIAIKMKQMGRGPFTVPELMERFGDDSDKNIRKQLASAITNGYVSEGDDDTFLSVL